MPAGRPLKFPDPNDYPPKHSAVLCPGERVIGLYKQGTGNTATRISKKVREWFHTTAHDHGWAGAHFLPEVQTQHGAGCVLWKQPTVQVAVSMTTLVLEDTGVGDD